MDAQHISTTKINILYVPKSHFAKAIMKRRTYKHIEHILPKTIEVSKICWNKSGSDSSILNFTKF
jgi:hypothetical protein